MHFQETAKAGLSELDELDNAIFSEMKLIAKYENSSESMDSQMSIQEKITALKYLKDKYLEKKALFEKVGMIYSQLYTESAAQMIFWVIEFQGNTI